MKEKRKLFSAVLAAVLIAVLAAGFAVFRYLGRNSEQYTEPDSSYRHISAEDSFSYVENHPAFAPFSSFIQPWKDRMSLMSVPFLSVRTVSEQYHTNTQSIVDGFNFVIDAVQENGNVYYDFYTEEEREQDPTKEETGLIFIPGDRDAPVAVLTSGGAFKSVCLCLEGFPVGNILHQAGYNVAILKYRVNPNADTAKETMDRQEKYANEDFGRAVQFLFEHQQDLGISMEDYSVWGFSAGGRTTFLWGLDNEYGYKAWGLPAPAAMMLVYSGWYDEQFKGMYDAVPPTYMAWLPEDDTIGPDNVERIRQYIEMLEEKGIPFEEESFFEARHGFGEGRGTDAEGWIGHAVSFWENMRQQTNEVPLTENQLE